MLNYAEHAFFVVAETLILRDFVETLKIVENYILLRNNYPIDSRAELDIPHRPSDPVGEPTVIPYTP